ncbi:MAG: UDP-2,4-diacetamido-2,4,6-trideoxy-beta-L-altropyranose hydrolase [Solirubrobacteraceae bacterium]
MTVPALLIRADASAAIGMGHVMRCLALAEVYAERTRGPVTFLMSDPPESFVARAGRAGATVRPLGAEPGSAADIAETRSVAAATGAAWVVLDGYHFDGDFQAALAAGGTRLLALDDHGHAGRYTADLVLNGNPGADRSLYRAASGARLLLGARFALLRREFRDWEASRPPAPRRARRVIVTMGGSDLDNVSALVLDGLAAVPRPLEIRLIVGATNPHSSTLEAAARACPHPVEIAVDVREMAPCLAWGDLAVSAAGGTVLELIRVGTPVAMIVVAANQAPGAAALAHCDHAVNLGWHAGLDPGVVGRAVGAITDDAVRRGELSRRGAEVIDGRGAERVLGAMASVAGRKAAA